MHSVRLLNLTRDITEILHTAQTLKEKNKSCTLYLSTIPLAAYRQHTERTALGLFQWPFIHQGRCIALRSVALCNSTCTLAFFDGEENVFYQVNSEEIFLRRKNMILLDNEEKTGFLELITRKERLFLSFSLSKWPLRFL